jgi:hypothetical protein
LSRLVKVPKPPYHRPRHDKVCREKYPAAALHGEYAHTMETITKGVVDL